MVQQRYQPQGLFPAVFQTRRGQARSHIRRGCARGDATPGQGVQTDGAGRGKPCTSPATGAWSNPGPARGSFTATLADGSMVTYSWYRFVDQPSFQQYKWSEDNTNCIRLLRFLYLAQTTGGSLKRSLGMARCSLCKAQHLITIGIRERNYSPLSRKYTPAGRSTGTTWYRPAAEPWRHLIRPCS